MLAQALQDNLYELSPEDPIMLGYFIEGIVMAFVVGGIIGTLLGLQLRDKRLRPVAQKISRRD